MRGVEVIRNQIHINPNDWDAERWELDHERPGCDNVSRELNLTLMDHVNAGKPRHEVEKELTLIMHERRHFGAFENKVRKHLYELLDEIFGALRCILLY